MTEEGSTGEMDVDHQDIINQDNNRDGGGCRCNHMCTWYGAYKHLIAQQRGENSPASAPVATFSIRYRCIESKDDDENETIKGKRNNGEVRDSSTSARYLNGIQIPYHPNDEFESQLLGLIEAIRKTSSHVLSIGVRFGTLGFRASESETRTLLASLGTSTMTTRAATDDEGQSGAIDSSSHENGVYSAIKDINTIPLTSLEVGSLSNVPVESFCRLVKESCVLKTLEIHYDTPMFDFTCLTTALEKHQSMERFVFSNHCETTYVQNPTLHALGMAILSIQTLSVVQLGSINDSEEGSAIATTRNERQQNRHAQNQPRIARLKNIPFPSELFVSLVQLPSMREVHVNRCKLSRHDCKALADGLGIRCSRSECDGSIEDINNMSAAALLTLDNVTGLERIDLTGCNLSDDICWLGLIHSLRDHPTVQSLVLENTWHDKGSTLASLDEWERFNQRKVDRTNALLSLVRQNPVLQNVECTLSERDEDVNQKIDFFLRMNRLGLRRLKSGVSRGIWGQATIAIHHMNNSDPSALFFVLRERPDLVVPDIIESENDTGKTATNDGIDNTEADHPGTPSKREKKSAVAMAGDAIMNLIPTDPILNLLPTTTIVTISTDLRKVFALGENNEGSTRSLVTSFRRSKVNNSDNISCSGSQATHTSNIKKTKKALKKAFGCLAQSTIPSSFRESKKKSYEDTDIEHNNDMMLDQLEEEEEDYSKFVVL